MFLCNGIAHLPFLITEKTKLENCYNRVNAMAVREPLCSACAFPTASLRASQTGRSPVEKKVTFDFLEGISAPGMKNEVGGLPSNVRAKT